MNKVLKRYEKILAGKVKAKFLIAKNKGLLNRKVKQAYGILEKCELCERRCRINKTKSEKGECRVGDKPIISSAFVHLGEEEVLVPSFTIFFMGCNFHCQYCQNWSISQWQEHGKILTIDDLAKLIERAKIFGCRNVNFVGGDPTPQLPFILDALNRIDVNIPIVWNSNMYMSEKSMSLLKDVVDIYLTDFKYGNNDCAKRLSKVENYFDIATRNHLIAFNDNEMIIRHLLLPDHFECCTKPILEFIARNFKDNVMVNIMDQYRPCYKANQYKDINELLGNEYEKAVRLAKELKLNFI